MSELVLITGGSGYLGAHCIVAALNAGYRVRTTVRTMERADDVRAMVRDGGADPSALAFAPADLMADDGWYRAVEGCDFVLHTASPFPSTQPKDDDELVVPAREGTLRVLRAARASSVRRVVLTSSFAAIGYGHAATAEPFTETSWSDLSGATPYVKSKTLAERAAWEFIEREGQDLELTVINPTGIFGPVLGPDYASSVSLISMLLDGSTKRIPNVTFGVVDVRDTAALHLLAMTHPRAAGERFLATSGEVITLPQAARIIAEHTALQVTTRTIPDWTVRVAALVSKKARGAASALDTRRISSKAKAETVLGWTTRPVEQTLVDTATSLATHGIVPRE